MTEAQMLRYERRERLAAIKRERRIETIKAAIAILVTIALFAIAGTMDYTDRVNNLNNMLPSESWWEVG